MLFVYMADWIGLNTMLAKIIHSQEFYFNLKVSILCWTNKAVSQSVLVPSTNGVFYHLLN